MLKALLREQFSLPQDGISKSPLPKCYYDQDDWLQAERELKETQS